MKSAKETPPARTKIVLCPSCGGQSIYAASNPFRPFCSERCKNIDFGAWASESFRVPSNGLPEGQRDGAEPLQ